MVSCFISEGIEKQIQVGDFIETNLFSLNAYSLYEVVSIDESGLAVTILYLDQETVLSTSYILNVWRKI
jgi:hypothetical protein